MDFALEINAARQALDRLGIAQWEVLALMTETLNLGIKKDQVDKFAQATTRGMAVRVISGGSLGFAYGLGGGDGAVAQVVEQALASAQACDLEQAGGLAPRVEKLAQCQVYDPSLADQSLEEKTERVRGMARAALAADPQVTQVHPAEMAEAVSHMRLCNSEGLDISHRATQVSAMAMAVAGQGDQQEMGWEGDSARFAADLDPVKVGAQAGLKAAALLGAGTVSDGRYDLVLENEVAAEFLSLLASSLQGDQVLKGRSLLAGRLGAKVVSPLVTIRDDGLYPRGLGTAPVDSEGVPQSDKVLVDQGVLRAFVYDLFWGAKAGAASTGNAVRPGLTAPVGVGFTNLYLQPGSGDCLALAAGMDKGLIIREILGAHTADPVSGEFSLGASGLLVEGGKVVRPVKSFALAGQVQNLFGAVRAVGDDLRFFGSLGAPSLLVEGMSISGG